MTSHPWDEDRFSTDLEDPASSNPLPVDELGVLGDRNESVTTFLRKARHDAETYERHQNDNQTKDGDPAGRDCTERVKRNDGDISSKKMPSSSPTTQQVISERTTSPSQAPGLVEKVTKEHEIASTTLTIQSPDVLRNEKTNQLLLTKDTKADSLRDGTKDDDGMFVQSSDEAHIVPLARDAPLQRPDVAQRQLVDPGAVRVYVGSSAEHDESDNFLVGDSSMMNEGRPGRRATFDSEMAADTEQIVKAVAIDNDPVTAEPMKPENKRRRRITLGSLIVTVIILIVAVVVVLRRLTGKEQDSLAPSASPSQSPSYSTFGLEELIRLRVPGGDQETEYGSDFDDTPLQRAFNWITRDPYLSFYSDDRILQRFALVTFFYSLHGERWLNSDDWLNVEVSECSWYSAAGEACDNDETLVSLELPSNSLQGSLPAAIALLTGLEKLDLSQNEVTGTIPSYISECTLLGSIDLSTNSLIGAIPTEFRFMNNLSSILLNENSFSGSIPPQLGMVELLTSLQLSSNALHGEVPGKLFLGTSLQFLDLSNNDFTGQLPTELGQVSKLVDLNIESNAFISTLPTELGLLSALTSLRVSASGLEGQVPVHVSGLVDLEYLDFSDNSFSGPIPPSIDSVSKISHLDLSHNSFDSSVPGQLKTLGDLQHIDLSHNFFTGELFAEDHGESHNTNFSMGHYLSNLEYMDLGSNRFSGTFMTGLWQMSHLRILKFIDSGFGSISASQGWGELSHLEELEAGFSFKVGFDFSGLGRLTRLRRFRMKLPESDAFGSHVPTPFPTEIGLLTRLESFSLEGVLMSTCIPSHIGQLTRLRELDLGGVLDFARNCSLPSEVGLLRQVSNLQLPHNRIIGTIPLSIGDMTNLNAFNLAGNSVSGQIPTTMGYLQRLTSLDMSGNQLFGSIPTELSMLSFLDALLLHDNPELSGTFPDETFAVVTSIFNTNITGAMPLTYCDALRDAQCTLLPTADAKLIGDCFRPDFQCTCCTSCCAKGNCTVNSDLLLRCTDDDNGQGTPRPFRTPTPTGATLTSIAPSLSQGPSVGSSYAPSTSPSEVQLPTVPRATIELTLKVELGSAPDIIRLQVDKMLNITAGDSHVLLEAIYRMRRQSAEMAFTTLAETITLDVEPSSNHPELEYYRLIISDPTGDGARTLSLEFTKEDGESAGLYTYHEPFGAAFIVNFELEKSDEEIVVADPWTTMITPAPTASP